MNIVVKVAADTFENGKATLAFWRALAGFQDGENLRVFRYEGSVEVACYVTAEPAGDVWVKGWVR